MISSWVGPRQNSRPGDPTAEHLRRSRPTVGGVQAPPVDDWQQDLLTTAVLISSRMIMIFISTRWLRAGKYKPAAARRKTGPDISLWLGISARRCFPQCWYEPTGHSHKATSLHLILTDAKLHVIRQRKGGQRLQRPPSPAVSLSKFSTSWTSRSTTSSIGSLRTIWPRRKRRAAFFPPAMPTSASRASPGPLTSQPITATTTGLLMWASLLSTSLARRGRSIWQRPRWGRNENRSPLPEIQGLQNFVADPYLFDGIPRQRHPDGIP